MNAAILYTNLADSGVVTASSWIAAAQPALLQNPHVSRRWKGRNGDTEAIILDLASSMMINTICLLGCQGVFGSTQRNLSSSATRRIRVSSVDSSGVTGDVYDSGSDIGKISEEFGALVDLLTSSVVGRYVRIDLSEAGADAILAGRLIVGLRSVFEFNFAYGWSFGYADLSRKKKSAGGQTFVERDDRYRILNVTFESVSGTDRYGLIDPIDRRNGISKDVLFVTDPLSDRPDRDSVWGLVQDMSPPTQPYFSSYSKSYAIEERL